VTRLAASGVCAVAGGRAILDDVTLEIAAGELVAVLGANGSGKTTLLRVLAGLRRPEGGTVALDGEPLAGLGRREIARRLAIVPQFPSVELGFTALEVVLMGRAPHARGLGLARSADLTVARRAMDELEVAHLAGRPLDTLSGGERQRVVLARALAQQGRLLLLDEPTTALDLGRQQDVLDLVEEQRAERGLTVLATLHDLTLAGRYGERVALLAEGTIAAEGPPREVLTEANIAEHFAARVRVLDDAAGPIVVPV